MYKIERFSEKGSKLPKTLNRTLKAVTAIAYIIYVQNGSAS